MLPSEFQWPDKSINKSEAATCMLEAMQNGLQEDVNINLEDALILKDLYDCRKCAFAIAVCYLKGIMEPSEERFFGTKEICTADELELYKRRLFDTSARLSVKQGEREFLWVDYRDLVKLSEILLVDVSEEGISELKNAVRRPLSELKINPKVLCSYDKFSKVVFVCRNGANALLAAKIARENGFRHVYYTSVT